MMLTGKHLESIQTSLQSSDYNVLESRKVTIT